MNDIQDVKYVKGHASFVVAGADESTNLSVFSVGRITAINHALFKPEVNYYGIADIAFVSISSANGKFGGLRTANAHYFNTKGLVGVYAPNVEFTGPVYVGEITAHDDAQPMLLIGSGTNVRITGGDLLQANSRPVAISGITQLLFTDGTASNGQLLPAQANKGRLRQNGVDVTLSVVVDP